MSRPSVLLPQRAGRAWAALLTQEHAMLADSLQVVWLRNLRFVTGRMSASEATLMVVEKPVVAARAAESALHAAVAGEDAFGIASAALRPIGAMVLWNARRLRG